MPGFELPLTSNILIEEGNFTSGDFVLYSFIELYVRNQTKILFIAAKHSFAHYSAVFKKMVRKRVLI